MNDDSLKKRCRIATQSEGDNFVGVKADTDDALVFFPLGYQLSDNNHDIRNDILHLFSVLSHFKDKQESVISIKTFKSRLLLLSFT